MVVIAAVTLTISVIGHGLIMKIYLPITIALAVVFGVLAVSVGTTPTSATRRTSR